MKAVLCSLIAVLCLAACGTPKPVFPSATDYEQRALEKYQSGEISYAEYQQILQHESDNTP